MLIFFARDGCSLGTLQSEVKTLPIMTAGEFDLTKEELSKMRKGNYIHHRKGQEQK